MNDKVRVALLNQEINYISSKRQQWERNAENYCGNRPELVNENVTVQGEYGNVGTVKGSDLAVAGGIPFRENQTFPHIDTMVAGVCPLNPTVAVTPLRAGKEAPARVRQALLNYTFQRGGLRWELRRAVTLASLMDRAFLKVFWQPTRRMPAFAAMGPNKVLHDRHAPRWAETRWIAEAVRLDQYAMAKRFQRTGAEGALLYDRSAMTTKTGSQLTDRLANVLGDGDSANSSDGFEYFIVYEMFDFINGVFAHYVGLPDGAVHDKPLMVGKLPYRSARNIYQLITLTDNLVSTEGIGDASLTSGLQQALDVINQTEMDYANSTIPRCYMNTAALDDPEAALLAVSTRAAVVDAVPLSVRDGAPIEAAVTWSKPPTLNPDFPRMRERAVGGIQYTMGLPEFTRGVVGTANLATEATLADNHLRTRVGWRSAVVEETIQWCATRAMGLYEEFLAPEDVIYVRLAGDAIALAATRADLEAMDWEDGSQEPMDFEYSVLPYSPAANNPVLQQRSLERLAPILVQLPDISQEKLAAKLSALIGMPELFVAGGGKAGVPGQMPAASGGDNPIEAVGGLPPELLGGQGTPNPLTEAGDV